MSPSPDRASDPHLLPRGARLAAPAVFAVTLGLAASRAGGTVGPGDSGEFAVALSSWGVAHAPGYPLLALLGNLATHAIHAGEPAATLNLLNAAFAAIAAGLVALAVAILTRRAWAGLVAGLALGLSPSFFRYALHVEVVSLNALLAAGLLACFASVLHGVRAGRPRLWPLPLSVLAATATVTHHATLAFVAAPLFVAGLGLVGPLRRLRVPRAQWTRCLTWCAVALVVGLLPLAYLPLAARFDPPLNWGNPRDAASLLHGLLRADFGPAHLIAPQVTAQAILTFGEAVSPHGWRFLRAFVGGWPGEFGWPWVVCLVLGVAWTARRDRVLLAFVLAFALGQAWFFSRVNTPFTPLFAGETKRFFVLPDLVLAVLAGAGAAMLMDLADRGRRWGAPLVGVALLAGSVAVWAGQTRHLDERRNAFTRDLAFNATNGMPQGAIAIVDGDLFRNGIQYQQVCLGGRRDLRVVLPSMMSAPWYVEQLRRRGGFELPPAMTTYTGEPGTDVRSWFERNVGRGPEIVVVGGLPDASWQDAYTVLPCGLWSLVTRKSRPVDLDAWVAACRGALAGWRTASLHARRDDGTWEGQESVFYRYALGSVEAVGDIAAAFGRVNDLAQAPALAAARTWQGKDRADFLAYQADLWRTCLADSLLGSSPEARRTLGARALELAGASVAIDSANVQALQVLAWLHGSAPEWRDAGREAGFRRRIMAARPGDIGEMMSYLRAVAAATSDSGGQDAGVLEAAEAVRGRFVAVLTEAASFVADPVLLRVRDYWRAPLQGAQDPRLAQLAAP